MTKNIIRRGRNLILIGKILNIIVLICSVVIFIILSVSILDTQNSSYIPHKLYLNLQLIICLFFFFDFWYLFFLSRKKWKYFLTNLLYLLISIPYLNFVDWLHIDLSIFWGMILRAILLIRGGYGLVIMITWFTKSKMTNLLLSYTAALVGTTYFGSLAFFSIEHNSNQGVKIFGDAVWWACMDVTTVGCDIEPTTSEGRILAVVLAVMGMSMFPILTAYITNRFQNKIQKSIPKNKS